MKGKFKFLGKIVLLLIICNSPVKSFADLISFAGIAQGCSIFAADILIGLIPQYEQYTDKEGKTFNGAHFNYNINYIDTIFDADKKRRRQNDRVFFSNQFNINYTLLSQSENILRVSYLPMIGFNLKDVFTYTIICIGAPVGYFNSKADKNHGIMYGATVDIYPFVNVALTGTYERRYDTVLKQNSGHSIYCGLKLHLF